MAAVLSFDRDSAPSCQAPTREQAEAGVAVALVYLASLPARLAVPLINQFRTQFDAVEAVSLATVVDDNGNTKTAESIAGKGGQTSKRARKRSAKRAAAVKKNAAIADKMAKGELSGEHVDVLVDAAAKTDGASLSDEALIADVAAVNPDLGKGVIDEYLLKNSDANAAQTRHDRQRSKRRVSRFSTKDDCEAILIAGDKATIDHIWNQTTRIADAMYRRDGGRDLPASQHRSHDQRMFDALTGSITVSTPAAGDTTGSASDTAAGDSAGPAHNCDPRSATPAPRAQRSSKRYTPRKTTVRPAIVIAVTLEKYVGLDPNQAAEMIGTGPIADSVLAEYLAADPDIVGAVFGMHGQPLWWGRNIRLATDAQQTALIVRDKHCVLCGADHTRCQAHHLMPWNAPAKGETDINKLALVCNSCHHMIHQDQLTLYRDRRNQTWELRPALPHEIPPPAPPRPARGEGPQRK